MAETPSRKAPGTVGTPGNASWGAGTSNGSTASTPSTVSRAAGAPSGGTAGTPGTVSRAAGAPSGGTAGTPGTVSRAAGAPNGSTAGTTSRIAGASSGPSGPTPAGPVLSRLKFARAAAAGHDADAAPQEPVCSRCEGRGYELYTVGEWARARVCACRGECPACKGRGYRLEVGEDGYTYHNACDCQQVQRRLDRFNQALIPGHFAHRDLKNFDRHQGTELAYEHVRHYARGFPADKTGILLVGPPGVGKTHLVVGVLKVLTLEKGVRCLFKDFFLLLSEVKQAYETGRFESEVLRPLTEVDVLVVDELGKGRSNSDWEQGLLDEIICKRYNQMKTTLLTTNFPLDLPRDRPDDVRPVYGSSVQREGLANLTSPFPKTLEERVGERIFSRLKQMCMFLRVEAADYRRTHAAGGGGRARR